VNPILDINEGHIITRQEGLQYNIWQELKAIRTLLEMGALKPEKPAVKEAVKTKCQKCGKEFESKGKFLAHTRTAHKKEAAKKSGTVP
jgi:hypothetical protein